MPAPSPTAASTRVIWEGSAKWNGDLTERYLEPLRFQGLVRGIEQCTSTLRPWRGCES